MSIHIPIWLLWVVGVPVALFLVFCLLVGIVMVVESVRHPFNFS